MTVEVPKTDSFLVLEPQGPQVTKISSHVVLEPQGPQVTKINSYLILDSGASPPSGGRRRAAFF